MNSVSSQAPAEDCSEASSWDGSSQPQLSGMPTASECSARGAATWPTPNVMDAAGMRLNQSPEDWLEQSRKHAAKGVHKQYPSATAVQTGIPVERDFLSTPTSATSTPSPDRATSSPEASPASRSVRPGSGSVRMTPATCGHQHFASLSSRERPSPSGRTCPASYRRSARCAPTTGIPSSGSTDAGTAPSAEDEWQTPQSSLITTSERYSQTWPARGSMRNGACWEQTMSVPRIDASGCGYWPSDEASYPTPKGTPSGPDFARASRPGSGGDDLATAIARGASTPQTWATPEVACALGGHLSRGGDRKDELLLGGQVKANPGRAFATPRAEDSQCAGRRRGRETSDTLYAQTVTDTQSVPGSLNPDWVSWLMGWPVGWEDASLALQWECPNESTACAHLGTVRCLSRWQRLGRTWLTLLGYFSDANSL